MRSLSALRTWMKMIRGNPIASSIISRDVTVQHPELFAFL